MARLEEIKIGCIVNGIIRNQRVEVTQLEWYGNETLEVTFKNQNGYVEQTLLYRLHEPDLSIAQTGLPWGFDGDTNLFRLTTEARRIELAHLFDPHMAVHTSQVQPLPHQITAVYEEMLTRQPLRYVLADDPGAGKTIMTGLLIKELQARGDLERCLIVSPGALVEQWQDELRDKFNLKFEIMTNDKLAASNTGNWFSENPFAIARLDKLKSDESVQAKLQQIDWDLIVCDEAHKMSASYFGNEVKYTKRFQLGRLLSGITRHFLLLTATPHNGKETDFQLFMSLIDGDRFEGKFRDGVHVTDTSDLMRRMVKEQLVKFDGKPLFPERIAYTVTYTLSKAEAALYRAVTEYVTQEFDRADQLNDDKRKGTIGFALTIVQRRLASSPAAIYESLRRRRERLQKRLREERLTQRGRSVSAMDDYSRDDLEDLDEAPENELVNIEDQLVDQATASRSILELEQEIQTLERLEQQALELKRSGKDRKWDELSRLLQGEPLMTGATGERRKLVIFTEHRDTLTYLKDKICTLLGDPSVVEIIHGGIAREERLNAQQRFKQERQAQVLLATDAAGEGINLQVAHLMVNYDLPWNPNRLEQRFGRIHRIGQTEVCHLWNLVAHETREGDVYQTLLRKLDNERAALGGAVFDVLPRLTFGDHSLRDLLIEAIRYGEQPNVKERLNQTIETALDREHLTELLAERAIAHNALSNARVQQIREEMDRADARRLQPFFIQQFFRAAFAHFDGNIRELKSEPERFNISHVPIEFRRRDRIIGRKAAIPTHYTRVTFEKDLISVPGIPLADFICPGHPLLDVAIALLLERHANVLKQGTVFIDRNDWSDTPYLLVGVEHEIMDSTPSRHNQKRLASKEMRFVHIGSNGEASNAGYAPYLDLESPTQAELALFIRHKSELSGLIGDVEKIARTYAIKYLVPDHLQRVKTRREYLANLTRQAVHQRLTLEINHWERRAIELRERIMTGRAADLTADNARNRADELAERLRRRMEEIEQSLHLSPQSPNIFAGALVLPMGLMARWQGSSVTEIAQQRQNREVELRAMQAVMAIEAQLGNRPKDVSASKCGYDIESMQPNGQLRFIEVKGRQSGAVTVTVTKNEVVTALNKPDAFVLALVSIDGDQSEVRYVCQPFTREPDINTVSVNYDLRELLLRAINPLTTSA